jgi:hypothetical protein
MEGRAIWFSKTRHFLKSRDYMVPQGKKITTWCGGCTTQDMQLSLQGSMGVPGLLFVNALAYHGKRQVLNGDV